MSAATSTPTVSTSALSHTAVDRLFAGGRVLGDGAMGTMLYARGIFINRCYDELNLSQPDIIAIRLARIARGDRLNRLRKLLEICQGWPGDQVSPAMLKRARGEVAKWN